MQSVLRNCELSKLFASLNLSFKNSLQQNIGNHNKYFYNWLEVFCVCVCFGFF